MKLNKSLKLNKLQYYVKHISIINAVFMPDNLKLSLKEIEVIASFLKHTENLGPEYLMATVTREKVMAEMNISHGGLSNYLRQFRIKGVLKDNMFHKVLYPVSLTEQEFNLKLILSGN